MITVFYTPKLDKMRTAVFTFLTVSALAMGAIGIYSADAAIEHAATDGYGISALAD